VAMQAGCGFKAPPPVFPLPRPVTGKPPRRLDVTSSPPRDAGSDIITEVRRSGQWVTLSKTLLLQLVERICQLSFQTDVASSNASARLYRKSADELGPEVEIDSFRRCSNRGESPSERLSETDNGQDIAADCAPVDVSQTPLRQNDSAPNYDQTTYDSDATPADVRPQVLSAPTLTVDSDAADASLNVDCSDVTERGVILSEAVRELPDDVSGKDEKHAVDRRHHHEYLRRRRYPRSACRYRQLLRTRRRRKAALTTSGGVQVRWQTTNRRLDDDRRPRLHGVRRCRQSWMMLSKDIVYGAVENELRQVDEFRRPVVVPPPTSRAKSTAIWNPATCLSPTEKRRALSSHADVDCAPTRSNFRYGDGVVRQTGNDVAGRTSDATSIGSSSMLSELLGFGSTTPEEVVLTRQRRCNCGGGESASCEVVSVAPSVTSGSGAENHSVQPRPVSEADATNALNYCVRRLNNNLEAEATTSSVPRIWRPVESYPVRSSNERAVAVRPRWVAVNKGDVCSLVDNLVLAMIASDERRAGIGVSGGTAGDVRDASTLVAALQPASSSSSSHNKPAVPVAALCSVAASEPRKWKTDLLQRMRNEDT